MKTNFYDWSGRGKSGKYTIVLSNDAGETEKDIYVNFLGKYFYIIIQGTSINDVTQFWIALTP